MREYVATPAGEQIAVDTGLDLLARRLYDRPYDKPQVILSHLTVDNPLDWDDPLEDIVADAVKQTRSTFKTPEELVAFDRGLSIDKEQDVWRHFGDYEEEGLFPIRSISQYAGASQADQLVLSGAAGVSLANFRQQCPLLSRSRYAEFGFKSFNEACAFVGAYVVGHFIRNDRRKIIEPSFSYLKNGIQHMVSVGATFHGDFRLSEIELAQSGIVSPINTYTEFGPKPMIEVVGYHSVEPSIVATLLEAELLRSGKEGALQLVGDFISVLNKSADDKGEIDFQVGNFGDYGDRDIRNDLIVLELLLTHDDYDPQKRHASLYSTPYAPRSSIDFEIVPTDAGVKFQNRREGETHEVRGINLEREHYQDFFKTLIGQTSEGLGRTAPYQIMELVYRAKMLIDRQL